jgi:hypothetical protein
MEKKINIDYIGVVKENKGSYTYEQIVIQKSRELLTMLDAMCKNSNRTVLEMHDCFTAHFGVKPKTAYDCCLPYDYDSSYIGYVCLPEMMTIEQYRQGKQEVAEKARREFEDRAKNSPFVTSFSQEQAEIEISNRIANWDKNLKDKFYREAVRYIQAADFATTTESIKNNDQIRMLSHEHIGWTTIKHKISDDLIITINTNFGYGASSYFMFNVCYKGIDLLPYALLVKYYYAGIAEIMRCTRSYRADRNNWALAMDFVSKVGNEAKAGELSFVRNWLKDEIDEMITRLYAINENPKGVLDDVKGRPIDLQGLCCIRTAYSNELEQIKAYPDEMPIIFKASKLTTALDLIDKLQIAGEIYEPALEAAHKIKDINRLFAPELEKWIAKLLAKMEGLKQELQQPQEQLSLIQEAQDSHHKEISNIYEANNNPNKSMSKTTEEYRKTHPDFVELEQERDKLVDRINNIKSRIRDYNTFTATLQKCYQRIDDKVLMCA